jgi:hypothetical protein
VKSVSPPYSPSLIEWLLRTAPSAEYEVEAVDVDHRLGGARGGERAAPGLADERQEQRELRIRLGRRGSRGGDGAGQQQGRRLLHRFSPQGPYTRSGRLFWRVNMPGSVESDWRA